jgi:SAM-dependent methyltransferase
MKFSLQSYRLSDVDRTISADERMITPETSVDTYMYIGKSTIDILQSLYLMSGIRDLPETILDFGCGHGRIARHLRAWAPESVVFAADIRSDGIAFCSEQLGCKPVQLTPEFGEAKLPEKIQLTWVGSVFTHVDRLRMTKLFDWLWQSVAKGGHLVITTHGEYAKGLAERGEKAFITPEKWGKIVSDYQNLGTGYQSYDRADLGDWGLSLSSTEDVMSLARDKADARLVMFVSGGWAKLQDVFVWQKL